MSEPWLLLETSGRGGQLGLAVDGVVAHTAVLDPVRRHNRDLAPKAGELLRAAGLTAKQLHGVMVGVGPGSYTGLRVGIMSAKVLAFATGCRLVAVPTFHAIAEQTPLDAQLVEVIADGLQGLVYAQRFRQSHGTWDAADELRILPFDEWVSRLATGDWVSGPGVDVYETRIPGPIRRAEQRSPGLASLFRVGLRLPVLSDAEVMRLEPLYLRPSSAEEKAAKANDYRPG